MSYNRSYYPNKKASRPPSFFSKGLIFSLLYGLFFFLLGIIPLQFAKGYSFIYQWGLNLVPIISFWLVLYKIDALMVPYAEFYKTCCAAIISYLVSSIIFGNLLEFKTSGLTKDGQVLLGTAFGALLYLFVLFNKVRRR